MNAKRRRMILLAVNLALQSDHEPDRELRQKMVDLADWLFFRAQLVKV